MSDGPEREMNEVFNLAGVKRLPPRYVEEAKVLDAYRDELESALEHQPATPADLALVDTARRCRCMILLLMRKVYRRGLVTTKGNIRAEVGELRAWLRLEMDALNRLTFRDGMKTVPPLDAYLRARTEAADARSLAPETSGPSGNQLTSPAPTALHPDTVSPSDAAGMTPHAPAASLGTEGAGGHAAVGPTHQDEETSS